ncbi:YcjF family protein [Paraglaciecola sp.]|uniref:YcjF family protein n=1 Tax=Paraglaciecola sp. TaxID=1920173 RepID=UPI003EF2238A
MSDNTPNEEDKSQFDFNLKSAQFIATNTSDRDTVTELKPVIRDVEFNEQLVDDSLEFNNDEQLLEPEVTKPKTSSKKWFVLLALFVVLASAAELVFFVVQMIERSDWLAGVWLLIVSVVCVLMIRCLWNEFRGLRLLKKQQHNRETSLNIYNSPAIGLAEQHCLKLAEEFPQTYQKLVSKWQANVQPSHTDNEVVSLFERQVLVPIDKLAVKTITQNSSAAGVMIAVSPFALLDMFIVLWRNVRMVNQVSRIYGINLGYWGRVQLIKNIFKNMVYAGAAEILSDAGNYALGAGVTGKLSTRVAQGLGASVLTTRVGLKAMAECRPFPCLSVSKPNLTVLSKQLFEDLKTKIS